MSFHFYIVSIYFISNKKTRHILRNYHAIITASKIKSHFLVSWNNPYSDFPESLSVSFTTWPVGIGLPRRSVHSVAENPSSLF